MLRSGIKRFLLLLPLCVVVVAVLKYSSWILPDGNTGHREIYAHYANNPDVDATFVKGFVVNDTLAIDATCLQANSPKGWNTLCHDFSITDLNDYEKETIGNGKDILDSRIMKFFMPEFVTDTLAYYENNVVVSHRQQTITIYHTENEKQYDATLDKAFNDWDKEYNN
jgi:hypothetical protein